ncbi:ACT domain-containing protein [Staphylococcus haemolyticus]
MKRILHLKVTDQVSTLNRITSAFVRLQYNINELTVKPSQEKGISDMQITADIEDEAIFKILIAKLKNKSVYSKFKILVRTEISCILMR